MTETIEPRTYEWLMRWGRLPWRHEVTILRFGKLHSCEHKGPIHFRRMLWRLDDELSLPHYCHLIVLNQPRDEATMHAHLHGADDADYALACENAERILADIEAGRPPPVPAHFSAEAAGEVPAFLRRKRERA